MLKRLVLLMAFIVTTSSVYAQIEIGANFKRSRLLQFEKIKTTLVLVNNSGSRLFFAKNDEKSGMDFEVFRVDGTQRTRLKLFKHQKDFNPVQGLILAAGETRAMTVNLNSYYPMSSTGEYEVIARIRHARIPGKIFQTKAKFLKVEEGFVNETRNFGVRNPENGEVVSRKYDIQSFTKLENTVYVLKVYDDKWVYSLNRLGPQVMGIPLKHEVDAFSNIHVLIQLKPKIFRHMLFNSKGKMKQSKFYKASFENVPALVRDLGVGKVSVSGGFPAVEGKDYQVDFIDDEI